ncbi:MAG: hypothetical protein II874_05160 [Bacteroidales bacterium]|nr:hypothetical protein [Bacteroidales bacterium]
MKKYINILFAATVAAFAVLSCSTKEKDPFTPGDPEENGCYGVYFPAQDASGSHIYSPVQDPVIEIKVARKNTSGNITVPVVTEFSEDGIFKLEPVTFADGQAETTFNVSFPTAKEGTNYTASIYITDNQYAAKYSDQAMGIDFSVMRVEMKDFMQEDGKEKAKVTFSDPAFFEEIHDVYIQYYEVDGVRYCETVGGTTVYSGNELDGEGPWGTDVQLKFKWYTNKKVTVKDVEYDWIEVEASPTGFTSGGNPIYMGDYFHMRADMGLSNGDYKDSYDRYTNGSDGYNPSYYDGHGGFIFNAAYWIHTTTSWYGYKDETPLAIAEGYVRVDYGLKLSADYSDEGVTPIYVQAGVDIDQIKYAIYEGELNSAQLASKLEGIKAGTEEVETFSDFELDEEEEVKYATLGVELEKTGNYTFVAVAYDEKGEAQTDASITFRYISAEDSEEYAVDLNVFTEDTPARYRELHKYDSFAVGIYGSGLTDVHMGIFTEEDIEEYGEETLFAAVKADDGDEPQFTLSAEDVEKINAAGGLYDVVDGLKGKTVYYVIVWATNGNLDAFAYDYYETDPLPYVWNSIGTGTLTDGFFTSLFNGKDDYTVACDFYQEASDPGLYMITGFQQELSAAFFGMSKEDMAPYENGNWKNAEVVIDAHDPNAVFISTQDYGVLVNSNYGWIQIQTDKSGKLADGVLTFPAKEMYVYLGGWYYANNEGNFKLVFPSEAAPAPAPTALPASAQKPTDATLSSSAVRWNKPVVKYERDPQPRAAKVTVSHKKQEKVSGISQPVDLLK